MAKFDDILSHPELFLHNVAIDNVIFGYHDRELKVLLQKPFVLDKWTVTGGYIYKTETIEAAAARIAKDRTGLRNLFLRQFGAFGSPGRGKDGSFTAAVLSRAAGVDIPADYWIFDYFVSVGFYTLTEFTQVHPQKGAFEEDCQWWPVGELPRMMFDHRQIVGAALESLRQHITRYPVGYELLPDKFTLPEIRGLYESVLGHTLDDRNFTKKLLATGFIVKLRETRKIGAHRSPFLYRFDKSRYEEGLTSGVGLAF